MIPRPLLLILTVASSVAAADVRILPIGAFGARVDNCAVDSFAHRNGRDFPGRQFKAKFQGLSARGMPTGTFFVRVVCNGKEGSREVLVSEPEALIVIGPRDRQILHRTVPLEVVIRSDLRPDEVAVRLIGLYNGTDEVSPVADGRAAFRDLDNGRYLLVGIASGRRPCVFTVDASEFARRWELDLNGCALTLDEHARQVR